MGHAIVMNTPSGPLGRVSSHLPPNVVVLIDALDECDGASTFDNPILRLLRDQLAKLPKQVCMEAAHYLQLIYI